MKKSLFFILILFCSISFSKNKFEVVINEICSNNESTLKDIYGKFSSWVELYNTGLNKVDLSGYGLSNENYIPLKWTFPKNTIINSKQYLIVFLSDRSSSDEDELHTNFDIDSKGDYLFLSDPNGELVEKVVIPELKADISYGRTNTNTFQEMTPSPLGKNKMPVEAPKFSKESGFYDNEFLLTLSSSQGSEIYYTIDSSNPLNSTTVKRYKEPIKIYDRSSDPNVYAEIGDDENSPLFIGSFGGYKRPKYLIDKAMVIRAYCENENGISPIIDNTYFVTTGNLEKYKDFTIVSLVVNPEDLFDPDKGIYVVGNEYIEAKKNMDPNDFMAMFQLMYASNFYKEGPEWEKKTNMAIFENGKIVLQQNVGIRIRGFSTKMQAGKSFNVYAKKRFGEKSIKNTLFKENYDAKHRLITKYKSIGLRNIFQEERIKDEIGNILLYGREYFQAISDTRKSILFLNGEYWGFYIIIEKFSESYFESHYDIPKEGVTLIKEGELSNGEESELSLYNDFFNEYSSKDVIDEKIYEKINQFIDLDSLIEHFATGVYLGTADWPGHNDGVWRYNGEKIDNNTYSDGRWRYISFDFDYSMGYSIAMWGQTPTEESYEVNNLKNLERNKRPPTNLFLALLKNEDFRNKYILRFCDFANGIFNLDKIDLLINDYKDNYLDMLANSKVRWKGFTYESELEAFAAAKNDFIKTFDDIRKFYEERSKYAFQHMKEFLELDSDLQEITINKKGEGKIIINSITPEFKMGKWSGQYFSGIPITITAIPFEKSKFKGWSGDVKSEEKIITLELNKDTEINVDFE